MALDVAHGAIQWLGADVATTVYTVSGLSFQPKAIKFWWNGYSADTFSSSSSTASGRRGVGFAVSATSRRAVASFSADNLGTSDCATVAANDCIACTVDGAAARDGELDINSFTTDGFTVIVDDATPVNLTIFWTAWGGSDITVAAIGDIAEPAATGNVDYTVTGFTSAATDQVVMFAGVQSTAAVNTGLASDSGLHFGFASGTAAANNFTIVGNSDDASALMDTDGYALTGECLSMILVAGGNPDARAQLTNFGVDNFRLNWIARAVTSRRSIFLALKGGRWAAGGLTIDALTLDNTATVSGLPFQPIGIVAASAFKTAAVGGTSSSGDRMTIGVATSTTSRRTMGYDDADTPTISEIRTHINYERILAIFIAGAPNVPRRDLAAINADGFRIIVSEIGAGASATELIGYLAFGSAPGPIAGRAQAMSIGSGALSATAVLSGRAQSISSARGTLAVAAAMSGRAHALSSGRGALSATTSLSSRAQAMSSGMGALAATAAMAGRAQGMSSGGGALSVASAGDMSGRAHALISGRGALLATTALSSRARALSSGRGTLAATAAMSIRAQAISAGRGTMGATAVLSGRAQAISHGRGTLAASVALSSRAHALSSGRGALSVASAMADRAPIAGFINANMGTLMRR